MRLGSIAWRGLLARPLRTALAVAGVALGVAVLAATIIAGSASQAALQSATVDLLGRADVRLRAFESEGFLPRTGSHRRSRLRELAAEPRTLVLFEAPHRIAGALTDLAAIFGADRPAAVCRELTKTYEEIRRGGLAELAGWAAENEPRGEITVVVGGAPVRPVAAPADDDLRAAVAELEAAGATRRDAIQAVADEYGLKKRAVYALVHQ